MPDGHRFILTTLWPPLLKLSYLSIFDTVDIFYLAQVMELLQILKKFRETVSTCSFEMLLLISLGHSGGIKGIVGLTDDHNKKLDHIEIEKKVCHALL